MTPEQDALVKVLAPEFSCDERMNAALLLAADEVSPTHCYRDRVVVLVAAHMLAIADRASDVTGPVQSKSEGGLSISFGVGGSSGLLGGSSYGLEAQRLNRLCYGFSARTAWLEGL